MDASRILIVEDDPNIQEITVKLLQEEGYRVLSAQTLSEAHRYVKNYPLDLIVLDIMMPDGSGMDFCREVREYYFNPIIILTVQCEDNNVVAGLKQGADDYMTKPYQPEELCARIEAHLRRSEYLKKTKTQTFGSCLTFDYGAYRAWYKSTLLPLKPKELLLLVALARNLGEYVTPEELYQEVWGMEEIDDLRTIAVHISRLRRVLKEKSGGEARIDRGSKEGYRLVLGDQRRS